MTSVVTITFNPCIDKSTTVDALMPEKKLRCASPKFEPGGGGINVSRAIKKLGGTSLAIYPAGGHTGKFLQALLAEEEIHSLHIPTATYTRENLIVLDKSTNHQYRFGMPGSPLAEEEWQECIRQLEALNDVAFIVASGSLPPGMPTDVFARIAQIAKAKNARLVIDTSGEALQQAVEQGIYLIKPNVGELTALAGKEELTEEEAKTYAHQLIRNGKAEIIVVSLGGSGAMLVYEDKAIHYMPPVVRKQSTVGAGDSMVAGIVHYLSQQKSIEEAVRFGVACGTAATLNPGTELCRKEDAERLYRRVKIVSYAAVD